MLTEIHGALQSIQEQETVRVLYACESGSRAWGFPSRDSDYDVRFIYVRPRDWYLSVDLERRDVIERPISDRLDVSGWDLRKALQLLRKSNPLRYRCQNTRSSQGGDNRPRCDDISRFSAPST